MKVSVIQPPYSHDLCAADELFEYKMKCLDALEKPMDLVVLPEYSDVPCVTSTREDTLALHEKYIAPLLKKCEETAKRLGAILFVNALCLVEGEYRNTTYAYNREGVLVGQYFKRHIPPLERAIGIASDYTERYEPPYILELEGLRFAFLTCYDFYFYEAFPVLARQKPDIIIGCSLQRSDTHEATEIMCRFLAYNTNAYVVRASVSFAEDAKICGASMVVSPKGEVLCNMQGRFGLSTVDFDPKDKYYKPAGFGRAPAAHHEYIEIGRAPWQYRPAGSAVSAGEALTPYPRVCAHRGFNTVAPENSMPAFGAAIAMGAEEIEFDLWATKDGELVSIHDSSLERTSDGVGNVWDHTYEELLAFDFGKKHGAAYEGLRILRFEDILKKLSSLVIMNIHVKIWDAEAADPMIERIVSLIRKYDCEKCVYFMTTSDRILARVMEYAPDIAVCVGHDFNRPYAIVDRAIALGAKKVQLFKPYFNREMIDKAHAHGIKCNVFYADEAEETRKYLEMGIDTILTNDYGRISAVVEDFKAGK
ncbi:MAG: hypothetical protein J6K14_10210 [Clostridia bacterium]|nr:hypothetical protein [Clostridia bacterium]